MLLDFARASCVVKRSSASASVRVKAAATVAEAREFFGPAAEHPWLELSEWDPAWLRTQFIRVSKDPEALIRITKLRYTEL